MVGLHQEYALNMNRLELAELSRHLVHAGSHHLEVRNGWFSSGICIEDIPIRARGSLDASSPNRIGSPHSEVRNGWFPSGVRIGNEPA